MTQSKTPTHFRLISDREADFDAATRAERDRLSALYDRRLMCLRANSDTEEVDADTATLLAGGIFFGFLAGMLAGALLLAGAALAVDTIRGWFL